MPKNIWNLGNYLIRCVVSGASHVSAVLQKTDHVISALQQVYFSLLVLSQMSYMFLHEMGSYPLGEDVKTLQGLDMLSASMVAVGARVQWFNGSVVQRRA